MFCHFTVLYITKLMVDLPVARGGGRGAINFFVSGSLEFWLNNFCKKLLPHEALGNIFALLINILWRAKRAGKFSQKLFKQNWSKQYK